MNTTLIAAAILAFVGAVCIGALVNMAIREARRVQKAIDEASRSWPW